MHSQPDRSSVTTTYGTALNVSARCVDVNVRIDSPNWEDRIVLKDMPVPLNYHDVSDSGPGMDDDREEIGEATIDPDGCSVNVGSVGISFRRTVRVPDMGAFTIYNSANYLSRLPLQIVEKGGAFIRELEVEDTWTEPAPRARFSVGHRYECVPWLPFRRLGHLRLGTGELRTAPFPERNGIDTLRSHLRDVVAIDQHWDMLSVNGMLVEDGKRLSNHIIVPGSILELPVAHDRVGAPAPYRPPPPLQPAAPPFLIATPPPTASPKAAPAGPVTPPSHSRDRLARAMFGSPVRQSNNATGFGASGSLLPESTGWRPRSRAQVRLQPAQLQIQAVSGLAAGGTIAQKVVRGTISPIAYDLSRGVRLHVAIVNVPQFPLITGLPVPASPVSSQTYLAMNLPWFELWEEHVPVAGNALPGSGNLLGDVKSVAEMDRKGRRAGGEGDSAAGVRILCI
ncbi:hypothetical protein CERSUDRAFT_93459 [Gelatoporia subvermispora B]|uniref:Uncharacterized protein n=1 Tax=Ceriporiopsis subvermispora (strain B) TaxID=914234 RepID=M2PS36_CERS8|nr:hypothetical protein CERSUDRAFT_93459 [Gelatoporia subvermispora B]